MKVIVCEDDANQRDFIYKTLYHFAMFHQPSIEIVLATADPEEVLSYSEHNKVDCYFFDIELSHSLTGMDLATIIRQKDPLASIIFVTTYADQLKLTFTYKLAALDFIVKADQVQLGKQLIKAIEGAFKKYEQLGRTENVKFHQIKIGELIKNVHYEDIYFFTTSYQVHKIELHAKEGYYEFYGKLKVLEKLDKRFYRCHKSYLINLQHIKEINVNQRTVTMVNDIVCQISFRAMRKLQEKVAQFQTGN